MTGNSEVNYLNDIHEGDDSLDIQNAENWGVLSPHAVGSVNTNVLP
jgi:hypothetical protein